MHEHVDYAHGNVKFRYEIPQDDLLALEVLQPRVIPVVLDENMFHDNHIFLNNFLLEPYGNDVEDAFALEISFHHHYIHLHFHHINKNEPNDIELCNNHLPSTKS